MSQQQNSRLSSLVCLVTWAMAAIFARPAYSQNDVSLAAAAKEVLRTRCLECHGGSARQAGLAVLDREDLVQKEMVHPGKVDESPLYQLIVSADEDVRMPKGLPPLSAAESESLRRWIQAGAPAFPNDVDTPQASGDESLKAVAGGDYLLKQILEHQRSLPAEDRRHVRYLSCHHLLTTGATKELLTQQREAFAKVINHLSWEPQIYQPEVVNPGIETLFAVDLRRLGWDKQPFAAPDGTKSALNLYDLVLLEYPYAVIYQDSPSYEQVTTDYLLPAGLVRPILCVRTDWFCSTATLPPLYYDLMQLPSDVPSLEKLLRVQSEENVRDRIARRGAVTVSGVSRNNRAVEWHPFDAGTAWKDSYWKSIDYASSKGDENIFRDPAHLKGAGGEFVFTLPNGLQGYFVADASGKRLNEAPTSIVTDKAAEDKVVRNALSCIRCHDRGMKDFRDEVRPAVELLLGSGRINKREVLDLYAPQDEMERLLSGDRTRFLEAMKQVLGRPQREEPLTPVSHRFLDAPLPLTVVSGELGLSDAADLKAIFKQPQFTGFGLVTLGNAGVIRRDMWEDYYDQVVRALGLGVPIVPLDGLTRTDFRSGAAGLDVSLALSHGRTAITEGDEVAILIENRGKSPIFIELFGSSAQGEKVILVEAGRRIEPGKALRFPEKGELVVKSGLGKEFISVLASETEFPEGTILRGPNIADRLVHPFANLRLNQGRIDVEYDPEFFVKRTIEIETH